MMRPAFAEPVLGAQSCFRAVLEAMSRPGRVQRLETGLNPPAPLSPAAAALLLTLADAETPLSHDAGAEADAWLRFHCGSPVVDMADAAFILAVGAPPAPEALRQGTDEEPQLGATLLIQVGALEEGVGWRLSGPGIEHEHRLAVRGLPEGFVQSWQKRRRLFPRGVDVIFCAGERIAALPRTTQIREG